MSAAQTTEAKIMRFVTGGALLGPEFDELCRIDTRCDAVLPIGSRLGAFEIAAVLASGGWGTVYRGTRVEGGFIQSAALKVFPSLRSRIDSVKRECELLASLSHPLIPRIYDAGVLESGESWFAMELVEGEQIDAHCQRTALSLERRINLLIQICSAIAHAHSLGIIHRDIKPSNILVDGTGHPKLLDFGISIRDSDNEDPAPSTAFTIGFASPEQLRGETLTTASDVFQIGLLAKMLLGNAKRDKRGIPDVLDQANLDAVVARATAALPERRYADALMLAADLRHVRDQRPAELAGLSRIQTAAILMSRHRSVSVVAAASMAFAAITATWSINETRFAASRMQEAEAGSRSVQAFVEGMVRQADPSLNTGDTVKALSTLDVAADQLIAATDLPRNIRLQLARTIVDLYTEINEIDKAVSLGTRMLGADQSTWRGKEALLLALSIARSEAFQGRFADARDYVATVRDLGASLPERDEIESASLLSSADISIGAGQYDAATANLEAAERLVLRLYPDAHPFTYQLRVSQSLVTRASAPDRSEWYASEAVRIAEELFGNTHRDTFTSRVVLANRMAANQRRDEALALLDATLNDATGLPMIKQNEFMLGFAEMTRSRIAQSAERYDVCIEAASSALNHFSVDWASHGKAVLHKVYQIRGRCRASAGDGAGAADDFRQVLTLSANPDANTPPARLADNVVELAGALLQAGNVAAANAVLDRHQGPLAALNSASSPSLPWRYMTLAEVRVGAGRREEARAYLLDLEQLVRDGATTDAKLDFAIQELRRRLG